MELVRLSVRGARTFVRPWWLGTHPSVAAAHLLEDGGLELVRPWLELTCLKIYLALELVRGWELFSRFPCAARGR